MQLAHISARTAIHEAYAVQLSSNNSLELRTTHGTKSISSDLIASCVEAGKVIAVVEALPRPLRNWLLWAYGPRSGAFELPAQGQFFSWMDEQVQLALSEGGRTYSDPVRDRIRNVVAYSAINYRACSTGGRKPHTVADIKKYCRIRHDCWRRDYLPWVEWTDKLCALLDRQGLLPVGKLLTLMSDVNDEDASTRSLRFIAEFNRRMRAVSV